MKQKLDRAVFERELTRLTALMSKLVPLDHLTLIYNELSWIPTEAWADIIDDALDKWDSWPRNFPKAIKALWFVWRDEGRDAVEYEQEECHRCHSEGYLRYECEDLGQRYQGICACGYCHNYRRHWGFNLQGSKRSRPVLRLTHTEIEERGWKMLPTFDEDLNWRENLNLLKEYDIRQDPPF